MGEYGREQRNKLSRGMPSNNTESRQLKGFMDHRPIFGNQSMMISNISNSRKNNSITEKETMQLRAIVRHSDYFYEAQPTLPPKPRTKITANDQEKKIIDDPFKRRYKNETEFRDHVAGRRVECGLIKKLAYWYRLPELMSDKLFVLGEAHNVVGHRTIVEESNQLEKPILTECGALNIKLHGEKVSETPTETEVKYESIESVLSKTLYGLIVLQNITGESAGTARCEDNVPRWFEAKPPIRPTYRGEEASDKLVPYYYESITSDTKHYLKVEEDIRTSGGRFSPLHYEKYNLTDTANSLIRSCISAINLYSSTSSSSDGDFSVRLQHFKDNLEGYRDGVDINPMISQCRDLANKEKSEVLGDRAFSRSPHKDEEGIEKSMHDANSLREAFMFNSIKTAKNEEGYLLAGIGDEHARSMKAELYKIGVKTVTYQDFIGMCEDAF